jgi:hypothetical protein
MPQYPIHRRALLKTLIAVGGGLTAATFLPARWTKPLVKSGVLPVHAQTSAAYYLTAGYSNVDAARRLEVTNIYAFVSSTPILSSPARGADTSWINGVPNITVVLDYTKDTAFPVACDTLPETMITDTVDPNIGSIWFTNPFFTYNEPDYDFELTFTSPQCVNSPIAVRVYNNG